MSKRARDEMETAASRLSQLVNAASDEAAKRAEAARVARSAALAEQKQMVARLQLLPVDKRELIFKTAVAADDAVMTRMVDSCQKASLGTTSAALGVMRKQVESIRALNWVVLAELAEMCGVVATADADGCMTHVCAVVREEIARVGSGFMVFQLLQVMLRELDAEMASRRLNLLLGSTLISMQSKFSAIRAALMRQRASLTTAPSSPQPSAAAALSDGEDEDKASWPETVSGSSVSPGSPKKVWKAQKATNDLADVFAGAAREVKRARLQH